MFESDFFFCLMCLIVVGSIVEAQQYYDARSLLVVPQHQTTQQQSEINMAIVQVRGQNVDGFVQFIETNRGVQVSGQISGLTPGLHGFHVHQYGDMRDGCKSMGPHFNPEKANHGGPTDFARHVGDLGNIEANAQGVAMFNFIDPKIQLEGPYSILGRGVVVHAKQDDLGRGGIEESRKTGNAGGRVACGIVTLAKSNN